MAPIPPGAHPSGHRVERHLVDAIPIFDRLYRLDPPMDCRLLFDADGRLWMSDTPQERIMMVNNGLRTRGHTLVGGLGLGLYPQYAAGEAVGSATRFTVIEQSEVVCEIVAPTLEVALDVPLSIHIGDAADYLAGPVAERYDTIFLDTWETLDAAHLPVVNTLRDQALRHLTPDGRLLLWGYGWMLALFVDACQQLLALAPAQRADTLHARRGDSSQAIALLEPVLDRFSGDPVDDLPAALAWCRDYALNLKAAP